MGYSCRKLYHKNVSKIVTNLVTLSNTYLMYKVKYDFNAGAC